MKRFLLDTNAVIALLRGNAKLGATIADAAWLGISIISKIEYHALPNLPDDDQKLFAEFEKRINIVDISNSNTALLDEIKTLRKTKNVKLPDAVIIASGKLSRAKVITADKQLLTNYPDDTIALPEECQNQGSDPVAANLPQKDVGPANKGKN